VAAARHLTLSRGAYTAPWNPAAGGRSNAFDVVCGRLTIKNSEDAHCTPTLT
jgi:hypothetical protein